MLNYHLLSLEFEALVVHQPEPYILIGGLNAHNPLGLSTITKISQVQIWSKKSKCGQWA